MMSQSRQMARPSSLESMLNDFRALEIGLRHQFDKGEVLKREYDKRSSYLSLLKSRLAQLELLDTPITAFADLPFPRVDECSPSELSLIDYYLHIRLDKVDELLEAVSKVNQWNDRALAGRDLGRLANFKMSKIRALVNQYGAQRRHLLAASNLLQRQAAAIVRSIKNRFGGIKLQEDFSGIQSIYRDHHVLAQKVVDLEHLAGSEQEKLARMRAWTLEHAASTRQYPDLGVPRLGDIEAAERALDESTYSPSQEARKKVGLAKKIWRALAEQNP